MSQLKKINYIENVLVRLIKCAHYFDLVSGQNNQFLAQVQNSIGESACVFWCHLFGSKNDELHFAKFFENESIFTPHTVKSRFLGAMNLSEDQYKGFWEEVKNCRDKFISHKEIEAIVRFPDIGLCRVQAEEYRRVLFEYSIERHKIESGWDIWLDYYKGQYLGDNQLLVQCEAEFRSGVGFKSKDNNSSKRDVTSTPS